MIYYTNSTFVAFLAIVFTIFILAKAEPSFGAWIKKFFLYFLGFVIIAFVMMSPITFCVFFILAVIAAFFNVDKNAKSFKLSTK